MRNSKVLIGLIASGLLLTGCGGGDSADSSGGGAGQKPLAVAIDGPQKDVFLRASGDQLRVKPYPELSDPLVKKVVHRLRETTLATTKVPGTTSASCPNGVTLGAGAVSRCVATYEGAEIPYEVKISDTYTKGSSVFSYTTEAQKAVLVAKFVYNAMYEGYGAESGHIDASKLACDEIPVAKTVEMNSDTGYTCQWWGKFANKGEPGYETLRVTIGPTGGVGLEPVQ